MPNFTYRAVTTTGRTVRGVEEAASPAALERVLARRGLYPLEIAAGDGQRPRRHGLRTLRADVVEAIRYLATLADAGFPLDRALGTVARVVARPDVAGAVRAVQERIRAGVSLADALREQPRTFPALGVGTVRAGERGGYLAEALKRLAEQLEREEALRAQLLSAMLYPAVMVSVGAVAVVVLVVFVLPRFVAVLGDAGAALPRSTSLLLGASHVLGRWWPVFLVGAAAGVFALSSYRHSAGGRLHSDAWLLRLPVVGALRQRLAAARLGRALATLLGSGLPVLPALDAAAESLADAAATEEVQRAREEVRAGSRLAAALGRGRAFPYVFLQMVELGEESGRLPEMLDRAATAAEEELRRGLERVIRLVEPTMIILFGAVVAFVALALLQAIYSVRVDAF